MWQQLLYEKAQLELKAFSCNILIVLNFHEV